MNIKGNGRLFHIPLKRSLPFPCLCLNDRESSKRAGCSYDVAGLTWCIVWYHSFSFRYSILKAMFYWRRV